MYTMVLVLVPVPVPVLVLVPRIRVQNFLDTFWTLLRSSAVECVSCPKRVQNIFLDTLVSLCGQLRPVSKTCPKQRVQKYFAP